MENHFIIGLGGTGGKIIRSFRKTIFQTFRQENPEGVNIRYLYVDSDDGMMGENDPDWKILGSLVQLGNDSQLCIQGADLKNRIDNVNNYPGLKGWLGDKRQWNDILHSFSGGKVLGGQKRRLGRFLFACNIEDFRIKVQNHVNTLQTTSGDANVTFHICCGLAGGTGSGAIIDVLAQIRHLYPYDDKNYKILVYTLLPEKQPNPHWDTGNYHANGYAALLELNALSTGIYQPHDVVGGQRIEVDMPFNGMYLFTNQNEQNVIIHIDKDVPETMSDFLYQKIVAVRHINWDSLHRLENMENGDNKPEINTVDGLPTPVRAKRFLGFGIKRITIPEEEIRKYLQIIG